MALQSYLIVSQQEHVVGQTFFNLDKENNVPALFSTVLLLLAAMMLAFVSMLERQQGSPDASRWAILAGGFLAMALDEALAVHERFIEPVRSLLGAAGGAQKLGVFYFTWVIPAIVLVVVVGAFFLPFILRLPRETGRMLVWAASIYLGGALGLELLEGWWRETHGPMNLVYHAMVSVEEGAEMIGVIVLVRALLGYVSGKYGGVAFTLSVDRSADALGSHVDPVDRELGRVTAK
jgi:hypothetical protein